MSFFEEVLKILMVGEDFDSVTGAFQIVSPVLEGIDDGKEFLVMDVIVAFGGCHCS